MDRDIKGANILVDNQGCIKLADFGASKQVAELFEMEVEKSNSRHESREERVATRVPLLENIEMEGGKRRIIGARIRKETMTEKKNRDKEREREKGHRRDKEKERDRKRDKEGDTEKETSRGRDNERERKELRSGYPQGKRSGK